MALYGQAGGPVGQVDSGTLRGGSLSLIRPSLGDYTATRDELVQRADDVLRWVQSGEVKLYVGLELPLSEAREAHRRMEGRETNGEDTADAVADPLVLAFPVVHNLIS